MTDITVKIDGFEGPLDLLLHLIQHLEMDIYDIPIAEITSQYLAYIHTMKMLELDVAGDYLVMAATLMAIKSKMLLPKPELDEEEEFYEEGIDPRDALVEQLLEYQKYKQVATVLKQKEEERSFYFTKEPTNLEDYQKDIPLEPDKINTIDLVRAFQDMLRKKKKRVPLQTKITAEEVTMEDRMKSILHRLTPNKPLLFTDLFEVQSKKECVTTFIALLELMKDQQVAVHQHSNFADITVSLMMKQR